MSKLRITNLIKVDAYYITPKYLQVAYAVVREFQHGRIKGGENIPSINELSKELNIARDMKERAYKHLKQTGVIESPNRKGYYVKNMAFQRPFRLFLLPKKLTVSRKAMYDSFVATPGKHVFVNFCIYMTTFYYSKKFTAERKEDCSLVSLFRTFSDSKKNK